MSYLLRKVSIAKWEPNFSLKPENFTADAITGCTRTSNNTLSVWGSDTLDFSSDEVEQLIVALATTMNAPDTIDLIWLNENWLADNGVTLDSSPGNSKFLDVNEKHKDLVSVDHRQLAIVGEHIVSQYNSDRKVFYRRIMRNELISLVLKWSEKENTFSIDELSDKWIRQLKKQ